MDGGHKRRVGAHFTVRVVLVAPGWMLALRGRIGEGVPNAIRKLAMAACWDVRASSGSVLKWDICRVRVVSGDEKLCKIIGEMQFAESALIFEVLSI